MLAQPCGELGFRQAAFGEGGILRIQLKVIGSEDASFEHDEGFASHGRRAFVAVDEGGIARQAPKARLAARSARSGGGSPQACPLLRAGQRRVKQVVVAYADAAAMFGQLAFVDRDGERSFDADDHVHL